jgi:hypothetical protein
MASTLILFSKWFSSLHDKCPFQLGWPYTYNTIIDHRNRLTWPGPSDVLTRIKHSGRYSSVPNTAANCSSRALRGWNSKQTNQLLDITPLQDSQTTSTIIRQLLLGIAIIFNWYRFEQNKELQCRQRNMSQWCSWAEVQSKNLITRQSGFCPGLLECMPTFFLPNSSK